MITHNMLKCNQGGHMRHIKKRKLTKAGKIIVVASILIIIGFAILIKSILIAPEKEEEIIPTITPTAIPEVIVEEPKSFTFIGVGDNLYHGALYYRQRMAGNGYNFDTYYDGTREYSENADLAYINMETICNGDEHYELSSYPLFNGPKEVIDAVYNAGFDWWSISSNHSLDTGANGLLEQLNTIHEKYPDIITTGSHTSLEDKNTPIVKEINGIKVGFLGYTYGLNGLIVPEDKEWLVSMINKDQMKIDMEALSKVSDIQMVAMHWGVEYSTSISEEQKDLTKYLNELGAEVIIGTHPHVIEPAEIYHGENQDTLVYYSLGNYTSAQDAAPRMVGGMASFTVNYDPNTFETSFTDVKFIPTVTWFDGGFNDWKTYTLADYNNDLYATHRHVYDFDLSKEWVTNFVKEVMGESQDIEIVYE